MHPGAAGARGGAALGEAPQALGPHAETQAVVPPLPAPKNGMKFGRVSRADATNIVFFGTRLIEPNPFWPPSLTNQSPQLICATENIPSSLKECRCA